MTGSALIACAMYFEAFIAPSLAVRVPELFASYPAGGGWEGFLAGVLASGALVGVGFLLFGVAMLRARVPPRWATILAMVGGLPFGVNFLLPRPLAILAAVAFGGGMAGLGFGLWRSVERPALAGRPGEPQEPPARREAAVPWESTARRAPPPGP